MHKPGRSFTCVHICSPQQSNSMMPVQFASLPDDSLTPSHTCEYEAYTIVFSEVSVQLFLALFALHNVNCFLRLYHHVFWSMPVSDLCLFGRSIFFSITDNLGYYEIFLC